ncbi:hypothetical protein [Shouchella clausii]|uniref:hypothetical protein n=1 Tax=Shouchella clausii TaxID=79880 RepID=UPI001C738C30|nr:hypothetical protein [Shouchella clausii]MBX0320268.1 hypothetical protein [Shouchella clausii]
MGKYGDIKTDVKTEGQDNYKLDRESDMWIVVVVDQYYPSVFHFDNEEEAKTSYLKKRSMGYAVHLAKVTHTKLDIDEFERMINFDELDGTHVESLDVNWHTGR